MRICKDPVQFDFSKHWQKIIQSYGHKPGITRAFNYLLEIHEEILTEFKYEKMNNAQDQIDLDVKIAKEKHRDLNWLRENFDRLSVKASLVLASDDFFFHNNQALEEATAFMDQRLKEEGIRFVNIERMLRRSEL